jgi:hypothetical protein
MAPTKGISRTSLWNAWKILRKDLRNSSRRDVIDFVDYDLDPEKWILRLVDRISKGRYEPGTPTNFTIAKSNGFSRTITQPSIPDLTLYRAIVDAVYLKSLRKEHAHVYFKRQMLHQAQAAAQQQAAQAINWATLYRLTSQRSFYNWLRYEQYRRLLLHQAVHQFFVITDISNFFDTILHSHVEEALRGVPVAPRMIGLLFFLLERLSIRQDYGSSHAISLPVDEFDCSRTLAHLTLFSHDDEMVKVVGEDNYVRWMDDQNFGVSSRAEGLLVLSEVGRSLARLHLSPNTKKSKILTLREARRHFHLDLNSLLEQAETTAKNLRTNQQRRNLSAQVRNIWARTRPYEGVGEFDKILNRVYRLAGLARLRFLRRRALRDALDKPDLINRISDYMRCSGTVSEYIDWAELLTNNSEQIYPDVNVAVIEGFLRLEADQAASRRIRTIATSLLRRRSNIAGAVECMALAPLLLLRFGDRRSLPLLERCFSDDRTAVSFQLLRSSAVVYSSYGNTAVSTIRRASSRLLDNHLADVVRLIERIRNFTDVPVRYKARLDLRYDSVAGTKYVDMRALLTVRLLHLSRARRVSLWVSDWKARCLSEPISIYDRRLLQRLF